MSETTELQRIEAAKAAVLQAPGGEIWLEELLIRGGPDGSLRGGHVVYAYRASDAFGGKTPPQLMQPFPVTVVAGEAAFAHIGDEIDLAAVAAIAERDATIADKDVAIATLSYERDALSAHIAQLESRIAELTPATEVGE